MSGNDIDLAGEPLFQELGKPHQVQEVGAFLDVDLRVDNADFALFGPDERAAEAETLALKRWRTSGMRALRISAIRSVPIGAIWSSGDAILRSKRENHEHPA